MQGLIIINGYPRNKKFYRQAERIAEELRLLGVETDVRRNGEITATIERTGDVTAFTGKEYDFAVYLDKDKYLGRM